MKTIVRQAGNIGPFSVIETLDDRLRCDGTDFQFSILGAYTISDNPNDAPPHPAPEPAPQDPKLVGTLIEGVMCSATRDDQNGLTAVAMGITLARASGTTFPDTVFKFANGNSLVITDANFDSIYAVWVPFRQSFFKP